MIVEQVSRTSLKQLKRRSNVGSFLVVRLNGRRYAFLVSDDTRLKTVRDIYSYVQLREKKHISKALISAHSRGRIQPNDSDMYGYTPIRLDVVKDVSEINENSYFDTFKIVRY